MKFELVDPAEWPDDDGSAAPADPGAEEFDDPDLAESGGPAEDADSDEAGEAEQDPQKRLQASTRRLSAQVKQDAALIRDSLSKLEQQVADLEAPVADSGHSAPPPSSFRAERFSTDHAGFAPPASAAWGRAAGGGPPAGPTMEPGAPGIRPIFDDRR
ncbi:hypothetical protein FZ103_19210 [Streptomonospora sp. PA3]|uniref:hypothetical protein n=1 Tax=Streptomonospora sp. PA3 TaxID=2607326 RepID=UPI0012DD4513|nr:hypothetical protein [Streptomonospora sp. PA3]MUL43269.1 hypothetical protein [Streptomonospora sp. PA3]